MACNETNPTTESSLPMQIFRFLHANRQAQLDWIRENRGTYITINVLLGVALLAPIAIDNHLTERAQRKYYAEKLDSE